MACCDKNENITKQLEELQNLIYINNRELKFKCYDIARAHNKDGCSIDTRELNQKYCNDCIVETICTHEWKSYK